VDELVGATEIAECFGLGKSTVVHDWRRRYPDFPQPVARLKGVVIWAWPDVEKWANATGRKVVKRPSPPPPSN
jgi:predicted DNA-binding transcriptional regulator AlpA